ncbi:GNAT family acetyltransferase [Nakamurella sp.]|uniref:GNAT family acetyltransferase n=1 Tax=Nakamurella sp. TaxID=1869182 RepID=UPI003B3A5501
MLIRPFERGDTEAVVALWERCELTRPWNDPRRDIERKLTVQPGLFLVGLRGAAVVASVMAGYDGHRGWVNYLAVDPGCRQTGLARRLMDVIERELTALGCPKISLQVRAGNDLAVGFYAVLGYEPDHTVVLGKRLIADEPATERPPMTGRRTVQP